MQESDILDVVVSENVDDEIIEENEAEAKKEIIKEEIKSDKIDSNTTYYIKVNNSANVVTIYTKDANGEYIVAMMPL